MIRIGLTGSIAMGKSTTAAMFADEGAAVQDADAMVHALYAPGGAAVDAVAAAAGPNVVVSGGIDRRRLKAAIAADESLLSRVEAIVHPMVREARIAAEKRAEAAGATIVVHDVPLLFETGLEREMDAVVVVTADAAVQRARAMARPGMTAETLDVILSRQTPDAEKRRRADFVIDTTDGLAAARAQVRDVMKQLSARRHIGSGAA